MRNILLVALAAIIAQVPIESKLWISLESGRDYTLTDSIAHRQKRGSNDDPFSALQTQISKLARVVNGITVYNSIIDSSIPIDSIISELLGVGLFKLQDLKSFNKTEVDKAVNKIIGAKISNTTRDIGRQVVNLYKMKEMYQKIGSLASLPTEAAIKDLSSLKGTDVDKIQSISIDPNSPKESLKDLSISIGNVMNIVEEKNIMKTLKDLEPFNQYVRLIELFDDSKLDSLKSKPQPEIAQLKTELDGLSNIQKEPAPLLQLMSSIVGSSFVKREFTSGFLNGYEDLSLLEKDIKDSWVEGIVGNHTSLKELTKLTKLVDPLKELDEKWDSVRSLQLRSSIRKAAMIEDSFGSSKGSGDDVAKIIESFSSSYKIAPAIVLPKIVRDNSEPLIYQMHILNQLKDTLSTQLDTLDAAEIRRVNESLKELRTNPDIASSGKTISDLSSTITGFPTTIANFKEFLEALKGMTILSKETITAVKSAIQMNSIQNDINFTSDINSIANSITDSVGLLTEVDTAIETIKTKPTDENLTQLKELEKHSKSLGYAATIIDMVHKVLEKSSFLLDFVKNGRVVNEKASDLRKSETRVYNVIRANWLNFDKVAQNVSQIVGEVQSWNRLISIPKTDRLEDYGSILEQFSGLEDVDLDAEHRIVAIEALLTTNLDQTVKPTLEVLKASLEKVANLDLSFSKYSISGISDSLVAIQKVFLSTIPTVKVVPKKATTAQKKEEAPVTTTETPPADNGTLILFLEIAGGVLVGVALVVAGFIRIKYGVNIFCAVWRKIKGDKNPPAQRRRAEGQPVRRSRADNQGAERRRNERVEREQDQGHQNQGEQNEQRPGQVPIVQAHVVQPERAPVPQNDEPLAPDELTLDDLDQDVVRDLTPPYRIQPDEQATESEIEELNNYYAQLAADDTLRDEAIPYPRILIRYLRPLVIRQMELNRQANNNR
uniref:WSN domain-containing protein n=1 Tax=Caenorhabditis tropicalis TaxID=1561998 RepID=A0A1I7U4K1_9PELO